MKLRAKIVATLVIAFGCFTAVVMAIQYYVVFPRFAELARTHARADLVRARSAIGGQIAQLSDIARDWARRQDMRATAAGVAELAPAARPDASTLCEAELDLLCLFDADGRLTHTVTGDGSDPGTADAPGDLRPRPLALSLLDHEKLLSGHAFRNSNPDVDGRTGVMGTAVGALIFAVERIPAHEGEGHSPGTVVVGRLLGPERMNEICLGTHAGAELHEPDGSDLPTSAQGAFAALCRAPFDIAVEDPSATAVTAPGYVRGIHGDPVAVLRVEGGREIIAHGAMANGFSVASLAIAGALTLGLMVVLLEVIVIGPVARLTAGATQVGATGDLTLSVAMARKDEIGVLAREVDAMVLSVARAHTAHMKAAHEAGMADVASGVLHNVGNALNSLNVSANVLQDRVSGSELSRLDDLTKLLADQGRQLSLFLSDESRATQLREFVTQLAEQRHRELEANEAELVRLHLNLSHVAQIIESQQSLARGRAVIETLAVEDVASEAAVLVGPAFRDAGVDLKLAVEPVPTITIDRVRLLQVIVNLLTNAKEAVAQRGPKQRHVALRVQRVDGDTIRIEISDNGEGLDADQIPRLFTQGFTTKESGNGIGLHFCAVAVGCMNGRIAAHSDGPGRGATFTIDLHVTDAAAPTELAHA